MIDWVIESLERNHNRQGFCCGQPSLDDFLRSYVIQYEKRKLGRTFVAVDSDSKRVVGYYTLAAGAVVFQHLPSKIAKKLPKHPVPVALLARLAVDKSVQGHGLGKGLLLDALRRCLDLSRQLGLHAVEVLALDESAKAFYEKFGFQALLDNPLHLFLPMVTIEAAFGQDGVSSSRKG